MPSSHGGEAMSRDLLGDFLTLYDSSGEAPEEWMEQWAAGGPDPLPEAWARSNSRFFMWNLAPRLLPQHAAVTAEAVARSKAAAAHPAHPDDADCPRCADVLRAALPAPPPLEEVLARCVGDDVRRRWAESDSPAELVTIAGRAGADRRESVLFICECVRRASEVVPEELRSLTVKGLVAAERWTRGEGSKEELNAAMSADAAMCDELSRRRIANWPDDPEARPSTWWPIYLPPEEDKPLRLAAMLASASRWAASSAHAVGFESQAPHVMGECAVGHAASVIVRAALPAELDEGSELRRQALDAVWVEFADRIRARIGTLPEEHPQLARYRTRAAAQRSDNGRTP